MTKVKQMGLLNDQSLVALIAAKTPLATGIRSDDQGRWNSRIQPASLDLSIGKIYLPGTEGKSPGCGDNPLQNLLLAQGQTAVVETAETLTLPNDIAGIGFPPSSVSMQGLLMTNPGHVDPGYSGPMRFTVINIAKEPYDLRAGTLICTLLFFRMAASPSYGYQDLDKTDRPEQPSLDNGLLRVLSRNFMDIDQRAEDKATVVVNRVDLKAKHRQIWATVLAAGITGVVTLSIAYLDPLADTKERLIKLEQQTDLSGIKETLGDLSDRLKAIESQQKPQETSE